MARALRSARLEKRAPAVELLGAVVPCRGVDHKLATRERGIACDLRKAQVIAYGEAELSKRRVDGLAQALPRRVAL